MYARILAMSLTAALLLVAIALFASVNAPSEPEQQPQAESGLISRLWEPTTVYARRFFTPEIASKLQLLDDARGVVVVGHITCGEGQQFSVDVTVTQESTGASATGDTQGTCTGEHKQHWTAIATADGQASFEAGRAVVCAAATWPSVGTVEWCDRVRLDD